jgi:hypothetical protein
VMESDDNEPVQIPAEPCPGANDPSEWTMASVISIEFGLFCLTWDAGQPGAFTNMW